MASYDDTATVSGSVVGFSNGADSVPLKNWLVTLPASLDGYTAINGKKAKKNFLNDSIRGHNGANIYFAHDTGNQNDFAVRLRAGTYTFSVVTADGTTTNLYVKNSDTNTNITGFPAYNSLSKTFTLSEDTNCAVYVYKSGYTDVTDILTAQIEVGSTATAYEAYTAPTTYTASLGRTIYGGTADVVNGTGEETWYKPDMSSLTMRGNGINREGNLIRVYINEVLYGTNTYQIGLCNSMTFQSSYTAVNNNDHSIAFSSAGGNQFLIHEDSLATSTKEEVLEFVQGLSIVYPCESGEETNFTFTPLSPTPETKLGVMNFWSDQGNTELTYYKDGYGFTSVTVHKETPDGEPVEETRKLHRIIYEGQVDVISGTGLIYRGESGTQYDPPEQISFTPIEIATDEGENTLYADQGDSAITYRKAVD